MFHLDSHLIHLADEASPRDVSHAAASHLLDRHQHLRAPVTGSVYGTLLNDPRTRASMAEQFLSAPYLAAPRAPVLYLKPRSTMVGHGTPVMVPRDVPTLSVGLSLGLVIGKTACRCTVQSALDYVAGYVLVNDLTIPHTNVYRPSARLRSRDGFCPIGPMVVAQRQMASLQSRRASVWIDDSLRFEEDLANWVRSPAQLLADVTEFMTLRAGDVLTMGVAYGMPEIKAGQRVRIAVEGLGALENPLIAEGAL